MKKEGLNINNIKNENGNSNKVAQSVCLEFKSQFILCSSSVISQTVSQSHRSLRTNIQSTISNKNYLLPHTLFVYKEGMVKG